MSKSTIYGAAVVMIKDKEIYLCRRTENIVFPKKWQFVNARLRNTEQSMDTAIRVLEEQTMLKLERQRLHYLQNVDVGDEFYYVYIINLNEGEVPMNTCNKYRDDWKLFPLEKATVLDVVPGIRTVVRKLNWNLKKAETECKVLIGPPAPPAAPLPVPVQQQQQQRNSEEHFRQQLSHGEGFALDNMQAKMTRQLNLRNGYVPF